MSQKYHNNYEKEQKIMIIVGNKKNHSGHVGVCFVDKSRWVCQLYLYRFFLYHKKSAKELFGICVSVSIFSSAKINKSIETIIVKKQKEICLSSLICN